MNFELKWYAQEMVLKYVQKSTTVFAMTIQSSVLNFVLKVNSTAQIIFVSKLSLLVPIWLSLLK